MKQLVDVVHALFVLALVGLSLFITVEVAVLLWVAIQWLSR